MTSPHWFDPKITTGNVLTIIIVMFGVMAGWYGFQTRQTLQEQIILHVQTQIAEMREQTNAGIAQRNDLTERVIRIEEKMTAQDSVLQRILQNTEMKNRP